METKRSNSMRKVGTPKASKTRMPPKTQSQASVTPSQAIDYGEKNPLDALSRSTMRTAFERRCGLQDIDEEYLKRITMLPPTLPRPEHAAGRRTTQQPPSLQGTNLARSVGGAEITQQQQQQQQQQQPMLAQLTPQQQQMTAAQDQLMAQQAPAQPLAQQAQAQPAASPNQPQMAAAPAQHNQAEMPQQQQLQQVNYMPAAGEPELCTTCPHCQTTIYLARAPDAVPIQPVVGFHGQPEGANLAAVK